MGNNCGSCTACQRPGDGTELNLVAKLKLINVNFNVQIYQEQVEVGVNSKTSGNKITKKSEVR